MQDPCNHNVCSKNAPNIKHNRIYLLDVTNSVALIRYKPSIIKVGLAQRQQCHFLHLFNISVIFKIKEIFKLNHGR